MVGVSGVMIPKITIGCCILLGFWLRFVDRLRVVVAFAYHPWHAGVHQPYPNIHRRFLIQSEPEHKAVLAKIDPLLDNAAARSLESLDPSFNKAELNPDDDRFRNWRRSWPKPLQYYLRDSGILRAVMDGAVLLAIGPILRQYPSAWLHYSQLSGYLNDMVHFQQISYGPHERQKIDLIRPRTDPRNQLVVFVHGGAWGSGFPAMYRLVAKSLIEHKITVAIVGYRTYPDATINGQVEDVARAVTVLLQNDKISHNNTFNSSNGRNNHNTGTTVTLLAHSSGAHLCALGFMLGSFSHGSSPRIDRFVGLSGVYDIPIHYQFESTRGIERISPMTAVCGGASLSRWKAVSPTRLVLRQLQMNRPSSFHFPHHTLLIHGRMDDTVPYTSSVEFGQALQQMLMSGSNITSSTHVTIRTIPDVGHAEAVEHFMFGGPVLDAFLEWMTMIDSKGIGHNGNRD